MSNRDMNELKQWRIEIYLLDWMIKGLDVRFCAMLKPCYPAEIVNGSKPDYGKSGTYEITGVGQPSEDIIELITKNTNQFLHLDLPNGKSLVWSTHRYVGVSYDDSGRGYKGVPTICKTKDVMMFFHCDL